MADEDKEKAGEKPASGIGTSPAAGAAGAGATGEAGKPFAVFPDADSLNDRLDRAAKKKLKDLGYASEEEAKAAKAELDQRRAAEAEAKKKNQTEVEQANAAKKAAEDAKEAAEAAREEAQLQALMFKTCAEKGIKNVDYAMFQVSKKLASMGKDDELDEGAFLEELAKNPAHKAALGMEAPAGAPAATGATTTTSTTDAANPPKPPGGQPADKVDATKMTHEEFTAYRQKKYGG